MKKGLSNNYQYDDLLVRSTDPYANAKYEIILDWLRDRKTKTILNAGCGSGEFSFLLAKRGYLVKSFDLDKDYVDLAKKNAKKLGLDKKCDFLVSNISKYKTKDLFDMVVANDVLEHIEDDKIALKKLSCFVKPKGFLIVTVPAGQYLFGYHDRKLGHFRRYSKKSFKRIVPKGFEIKKFNYFGFFLIPVCFLYSKILEKSYPVTEMGKKKKSGVLGRLLDLFLRIEKKFFFGLGTSLIFCGERK